MTRLRGAELQARFLEMQLEWLQVPEHKCMLCKQAKNPLRVLDVTFGNMQTERETGRLTINGRMRLRLCNECSRNVFASSAEAGVPVRLI